MGEATLTLCLRHARSSLQIQPVIPRLSVKCQPDKHTRTAHEIDIRQGPRRRDRETHTRLISYLWRTKHALTRYVPLTRLPCLAFQVCLTSLNNTSEEKVIVSGIDTFNGHWA
ncbi:hypothetical protein ElyMa_002090800 [Elysia marginata]|uniref:Uncharacterized protein n=1 Tax=Elysia marginata TaxID=1093978 RepID=A0AAV4FEU4_9GAST|nr:hypothetical protein ElyMa_002090800 [Elysia marginata]